MMPLVADENFNGAIVRGLLRCVPSLDVVRVQDVGLSGQDDAMILEWAARQGRVLLSHDVSTVPPFAPERVRTGQRMPGVIIVPNGLPIGRAIDDLLIVNECSQEGEWENRVLYLPL